MRTPRQKKTDTRTPDVDRLTEHLHHAQRLLSRLRLFENMVNRQKAPKHLLIKTIVHRQSVGEPGSLLAVSGNECRYWVLLFRRGQDVIRGVNCAVRV